MHTSVPWDQVPELPLGLLLGQKNMATLIQRGIYRAMQGTRDFVLKAVARDGLQLEFASVEFQGDKEIVLAAVAQNHVALRYASKALQGDHQVVVIAVRAQNWRKRRFFYFARAKRG